MGVVGIIVIVSLGGFEVSFFVYSYWIGIFNDGFLFMIFMF